MTIYVCRMCGNSYTKNAAAGRSPNRCMECIFKIEEERIKKLTNISLSFFEGATRLAQHSEKIKKFNYKIQDILNSSFEDQIHSFMEEGYGSKFLIPYLLRMFNGDLDRVKDWIRRRPRLFNF